MQAKIAERAHSYGVRRRPSSSGRLVGIIFDDAGNRMSPIRQKKGPKHIRYYASTASIKRQHDKAGSRPRVRADRLELLVFEKLAELQTTIPSAALAKVVVDRDGFALETEHIDAAGERSVQSQRVVCKLKLFGGVKRRLGADGKSAASSTERDTDLLLRVARAHRWSEELESGKRASALDIAEAERMRAATVMRDLELAWRSPRETEALLAGASGY